MPGYQLAPTKGKTYSSRMYIFQSFCSFTESQERCFRREAAVPPFRLLATAVFRRWMLLTTREGVLVYSRESWQTLHKAFNTDTEIGIRKMVSDHQPSVWAHQKRSRISNTSR